VEQRFLLRLATSASLSVLAMLTTFASGVSDGGHCVGAGAIVGCPDVSGEVGGGGATLIGEGSSPGAPGGSGNPGGGSGSGAGSGGDDEPCVEVVVGLCYGEGSVPKAGDSEPATPAVTISDIAHFRPDPPTQRMQPDGWMVVGLPTNIYARSTTHVVSGSLLGAPAEVRFTPVSWHWSYGDGDTTTLPTPGATWQSLGLDEFDATPTSHIYRASGTYVIDLDVSYTVAYRFDGGPWIPLAGTVVLAAPPLTATAGDAVTVLVDRDCASDPRGPGC